MKLGYLAIASIIFAGVITGCSSVPIDDINVNPGGGGSGGGTTASPVCSLPKDPGRCRAYVPSWYFNKTSNQCEQFVYGGCEGNENRFDSQAQCEAKCPTPKPSLPSECKLPLETGPCRALIYSWGYNTATNSCEQFVYGGCQGNANRFDTRVACEAKCH